MLRGSCVLILLFALAPPARAGERDDAELALAQAAAAVQAAERADASLHAASETRMARAFVELMAELGYAQAEVLRLQEDGVV